MLEFLITLLLGAELITLRAKQFHLLLLWNKMLCALAHNLSEKKVATRFMFVCVERIQTEKKLIFFKLRSSDEKY